MTSASVPASAPISDSSVISPRNGDDKGMKQKTLTKKTTTNKPSPCQTLINRLISLTCVLIYKRNLTLLSISKGTLATSLLRPIGGLPVY